MSTNDTVPATDDRRRVGSDLIYAQAQLDQALRVAKLAHAGASGLLEYLPRDASLEEVRERTEDSLVLFGQALRLVEERHREALVLSSKLVGMD